MRLIILMLFVGVFAYGQEIVQPINVGTPDAGDGDPLRSAFIKVNSNEQILETDISTLKTNTAGIPDGLIFTLSGDSMFVTQGDTTLHFVAFAGAAVDVTPPTVTAIEVGTLASDTVVITFNEAMDTDSSNTSYTLTEDGNTFGIETPLFSNSTTLHIPLDSVAEPEKIYLLTYARPGVDDYQDVAGNKLVSFTNAGVTNNVSATSDIYAYMLWEGDDTDSMGVMNFTWSGSENYRNDGSPPQGTWSTDNAAGGAATTDETHDLGSVWTFTGWWNGGNDSDASARYLLELDGVDIWFDYTDGAQYLEGTIGGQSFQSTLIGDETAEFKWTHMAVTYDGVNGYARTYLNGVNVSSDSLVGVGADSDGIVSIAWDGGDFEFFGDYDDTQFYTAVLTDVQIDTVYTYPGFPVGGSPDPPIPPADIDILWTEDWEDFSVTTTHVATSPTGIAQSAFEANFTNYAYLGSELEDFAPNADIVSFFGENVLKSWYLEDQCCTGSQTSVPSNGGTGIDLNGFINVDESDIEEIYISYNVWFDPVFENSRGLKAPGVFADKDDAGPSGSARDMISNYSTFDLELSYYTHAFYDTWGATRNSNHLTVAEVERGKWVNITLRAYTGTARGNNGLTEVFIDGIFVGIGKYNIPFRDTNTNAWRYVAVNTFMGGGSTDYYSLKDQWALHNEFVIFKFADGANVVKGSTPSATGRSIVGTLESISALDFPK